MNETTALSPPTVRAEVAGAWAAKYEPDHAIFTKALDKFSRATHGMTWFEAVCSFPFQHPWTDDQTRLFKNAVGHALKSMMAAPYETAVKLIDLKEMAAEQKKAREAFWDPLYEACSQLQTATVKKQH